MIVEQHEFGDGDRWHIREWLSGDQVVVEGIRCAKLTGWRWEGWFGDDAQSVASVTGLLTFPTIPDLSRYIPSCICTAVVVTTNVTIGQSRGRVNFTGVGRLKIDRDTYHLDSVVVIPPRLRFDKDGKPC